MLESIYYGFILSLYVWKQKVIPQYHYAEKGPNINFCFTKVAIDIIAPHKAGWYIEIEPNQVFYNTGSYNYKYM